MPPVWSYKFYEPYRSINYEKMVTNMQITIIRVINSNIEVKAIEGHN